VGVDDNEILLNCIAQNLKRSMQLNVQKYDVDSEPKDWAYFVL